MVLSTKKIGLIFGVVVIPSLAVGMVCVASDDLIKPLKASPLQMSLTHDNAPLLNNHSGTMEDEKGVTWEYSNADDYANGHVSIGHQGYFGVSSTTNWGYTGITSVIATFTSNNELWLLTSADGITWGEEAILTSGVEKALLNSWRYIRFYNWSDNNTSININSVVINYGCSGISSTDDVDGALASNVVSTTDNLTYEEETTDLSPIGDSTTAVRFTKTSTGTTSFFIGFGRTYKFGDIQNAKVEFDMKTSNINYGKTIQLAKGSSGFGSSVDSSKHSAYKCTNIQDDWYHIEVPVAACASTISGYGEKQDIPVKNIENKEIDGVKLNAGSCVIDNLRISGSSCELGIYNNPTWVPAVGEVFWLKVSWVGKLHSCTMTFSDDTLASQVPLTDPNLVNGSPFYINLLSAGTVDVTANLVVGYNRRQVSISKAITIN